MEREYDVVFNCPGCGLPVRIRSTRMARIEWDPVIDGRYVGWAACAHEEDEQDFAYIHTTDSSTTVNARTAPVKVHECSRGGENNTVSVRR